MTEHSIHVTGQRIGTETVPWQGSSANTTELLMDAEAACLRRDWREAIQLLARLVDHQPREQVAKAILHRIETIAGRNK